MKRSGSNGWAVSPAGIVDCTSAVAVIVLQSDGVVMLFS